MLIVVHHVITNKDEFWVSAQKNFFLLPASGVNKMIQMLPNTEMTEMYCVWDAVSIAALDVYLRRKFFDWSKETYFELNLVESIGFNF